MSVLFFTSANIPYEDFAPLYAFSILAHVPDAAVEIGVEDVEKFHAIHHRAMAVVDKTFGPGKLTVRAVSWAAANGRRIIPNSVRFINEPAGKADYIYIGDVDVIVLDADLVGKHLKNMKTTGLPYSNAVRPGTERMSGLHFAPMASHYPLPKIDDLNLHAMNDEALLYTIVKRKGLPISAEHSYRPVHGIHVSPNREASLVTDEDGKATPGWGIEANTIPWLKLSRNDDFRRLRAALSPRVQSCLTTIDDVIEAAAASPKGKSRDAATNEATAKRG